MVTGPNGTEASTFRKVSWAMTFDTARARCAEKRTPRMGPHEFSFVVSARAYNMARDSTDEATAMVRVTFFIRRRYSN
jgi:hypothetical protein